MPVDWNYGSGSSSDVGSQASVIEPSEQILHSARDAADACVAHASLTSQSPDSSASFTTTYQLGGFWARVDN